MVEQLLNHIHSHNLCKTTDKILLAVSGGVDSMVMFHLFRQAGFAIGVAHCNFQLRGRDSDDDEQLVSSACGKQIPFYAKRFDTTKYAEERKISIQMAARELRYQFFRELIKDHQYQYVATAHHLNDSLETVLLNLTKGTGIEGVAGIPLKNNSIIRPMLFATRDMLHDYALANNIAWREDSSNLSADYQRNFIRQQIVPKLKEINPGLEETFRRTQERLAGTRDFTDFSITQFRKAAVVVDNGMMKINRVQLSNTKAAAVVLWELVKELNFNYDQCVEITQEHQSGKTFFSSTHDLVIDRQDYLIQKKRDSSFIPVTIEKEITSIQSISGKISLHKVARENFQLSHNSKIAQLDADKIAYPLTFRAWKAGDTFIPLGMSHHKKISDFLIDMKLSLPEKEKVTVLECNGTIVWVTGLRIHDHFKVTDRTKHILVVSLTEE